MTKYALADIPTALSADTLGAYTHWVNKIPLLSEEEEKSLAENLINNNDLSSAKRLVMSHLRFVVRVARGYSGYGLAQADLIQEGNIGLMKAVKRFNPDMGVRLVSFAVHWIRAEIHEFIIKNWRIVKIATTKAQRKLFFNLRKASKKRGWFSESEIQAVAEELNVSKKEVRQMEMRLNSYDQPFEQPDVDDDDHHMSWQAPVNFLEDKRQNPESLLESSNWGDTQTRALYNAIEKLDDRSRHILQCRWLADEKATLTELAEHYGVSAERVRQLEKNAMKKVQTLMTVN